MARSVEQPALEKRIRSLGPYLKQEMREEGPILAAVMDSFQELDQIAQLIGYFSHEESYASPVPWWPIISVLGTYSSGKSTFINDYLGYQLQPTGNQAIDDKFTVICFGKDNQMQSLPGFAVDADPRFPFYHISQEIEKIELGGGAHLDSYLQLKTCPSDVLRGRILIDSPGFDAEEQRTAVLRLTDRIVDLSDLVLVFFDARHPEPGTMRDTLDMLVEKIVQRADTSKFLYILNQIDMTALEDNAEDVVAAWQRALSQKGLTAGRFFRLFSKSVAIVIEDEHVRNHYESKRDIDWTDINLRIQQARIEATYRVVGALQRAIIDLQERVIPTIRTLRSRWRAYVLWSYGLLFGLFVGLIGCGLWTRFFNQELWVWEIVLGGILLAFGGLHLFIRKRAAKTIAAIVRREFPGRNDRNNLIKAGLFNVASLRGILHTEPVGWDSAAQQGIQQVREDSNRFIQQLNNVFANPAGDEGQSEMPRPDEGS